MLYVHVFITHWCQSKLSFNFLEDLHTHNVCKYVYRCTYDVGACM